MVKWGSCAIILVINIGVYCIWIPARLQISQTYIEINNIFDRCEKAIYLLLDATLNFYFCYLVKTKLIKTGMTKYTPLYTFNMSIVFVSLSMDVLLIGMMSMANQLIYVQFHPLCFMVKLNIELSMADMISKVASAPGQGASYSHKRSHNANLGGINGKDDGTGGPQHRSLARTMILANGNILTSQKQNQFDRTVSDTLDEASTNRRYLNGDQLYHAWVSGGTSSPAHNARGRASQRLDERDSEDVEADIRVVGKPGDTVDNMNVVTKNTTVRVTWESVTDTESLTESATTAPSEADSMRGLRGDGS